MKVRYRANGETAELSDEAGRQLIDAGICDAVEPMRPTKGRKAP